MQNSSPFPAPPCRFCPGNKKKHLHFCRCCGADSQIRTGDLILTKDALYLLSYISMPRTGNDDIIHNLPWFGKGEFAFFFEKKGPLP